MKKITRSLIESRGASLQALALIALVLGNVSCGETKVTDPCEPTEAPTFESVVNKPGAVEIPVKISSTMVVKPDYSRNNPNVARREICTPPAYVTAIKKVLQLYEAVDGFNVVFKFDGFFIEDEVPEEESGVLQFMLISPEGLPDGTSMGAPFAEWGPPGTSFNDTDTMPTTYPGGHVHMEPSADLLALIHETGHALGLTHIPSATSHMTYETGNSADQFGTYYKIGEQDRADLTATFPTAAAQYYTISGTVQANLECGGGCLREGGPVIVHAVNVVNGKTYTGLGHSTDTNHIFKFHINLLEPGDYKILVGLTIGGDRRDPTLNESSWYVSATESSNDPNDATVLSVSSATRFIKDINVKLSDEPANAILNVMQGAWESAATTDVNPMFLSAGETTSDAAEIMESCDSFIVRRARCELMEDLQVFGSAPDVVISDFSRRKLNSNTGGSTISVSKVTITASANAVPGDRLVYARAGGKYIAGLIGINILTNNTKPTYINVPLKEQLMGKYDFNALNPTYWK